MVDVNNYASRTTSDEDLAIVIQEETLQQGGDEQRELSLSPDPSSLRILSSTGYLSPTQSDEDIGNTSPRRSIHNGFELTKASLLLNSRVNNNYATAAAGARVMNISSPPDYSRIRAPRGRLPSDNSILTFDDGAESLPIDINSPDFEHISVQSSLSGDLDEMYFLGELRGGGILLYII